MAQAHGSKLGYPLAAGPSIDDSLYFMRELMELCKSGLSKKIEAIPPMNPANPPSETEVIPPSETEVIPPSETEVIPPSDRTNTAEPEANVPPRSEASEVRFLINEFWNCTKNDFDKLMESYFGPEDDLSSFAEGTEPFASICKSLSAKVLWFLRPMVHLFTFMRMYPYEPAVKSTLQFKHFDREYMNLYIQSLRDLEMFDETDSNTSVKNVPQRIALLWNTQEKLFTIALCCAGNLLKLLHGPWNSVTEKDLRQCVNQARDVTILIEKIRPKCLDLFPDDSEMPLLGHISYLTCLNGQMCICCTKLCEEYRNLLYYCISLS